jgi:hypothetical protein
VRCAPPLLCSAVTFVPPVAYPRPRLASMLRLSAATLLARARLQRALLDMRAHSSSLSTPVPVPPLSSNWPSSSYLAARLGSRPRIPHDSAVQRGGCGGAGLRRRGRPRRCSSSCPRARGGCKQAQQQQRQRRRRGCQLLQQGAWGKLHSPHRPACGRGCAAAERRQLASYRRQQQLRPLRDLNSHSPARRCRR